MMILFFFVLAASSLATSPTDLCASFDDYSGEMCRIFSSCPLDDNSEFLFYSQDYPCTRYVVDKPEYYNMDMDTFRKAVIKEYFPSTFPTVAPAFSSSSSSSPQTSPQPISPRPSLPTAEFKMVQIKEEKTTAKPTNIQLNMFPKDEPRNLETSPAPKMADDPVETRGQVSIAVILLATLLPSSLICLVKNVCFNICCDF